MFFTLSSIILGFVIGAYLIYITFLFRSQDKLIFQKTKPNLLSYKNIASQTYQLTTRDGTRLQGWETESRAHCTGTNKVLIYFGGNAQDVSSILPILKQLEVNHTYSFNYRGYGLSEGYPSEKVLYSDSLDVFDHISKHHKNSELIVMGHSLGSAVAGYTAKHNSPSKLILLCPLHSISKIAAERFYVPEFLIKHKFSLQSTAKNIEVPTLVLTAENDSVIPSNHSEITYKNLPQKKSKLTIKNSDHNDLFFREETINRINNFIIT